MSLPRPNAAVFVLRCGRHQIPKIIHMINITRDKNGILLSKLIRLVPFMFQKGYSIEPLQSHGALS